MCQAHEENVSLFAERIFRLSKDAYIHGEINNALTAKLAQRQLVNYLIDGLYDMSVSLKIMRQNPENLNDALKSARDELNLMKRVEMRNGRLNKEVDRAIDKRNPEPMDISHVKSRSCHKCGRIGHLARNCGQEKHFDKQSVHVVSHRPLPRCPTREGYKRNRWLQYGYNGKFGGKENWQGDN